MIQISFRGGEAKGTEIVFTLSFHHIGIHFSFCHITSHLPWLEPWQLDSSICWTWRLDRNAVWYIDPSTLGMKTVMAVASSAISAQVSAGCRPASRPGKHSYPFVV